MATTPVHQPVAPLNLAGSQTQIALTDYKLQFVEALAKVELPEMTRLGVQDVSNMLETRYPINIGDPVFEALVADNPKVMELGEVFLEIFTDPFQWAVREKAARLRTAAWARRGWGSLPGKGAFALRSLFDRLLAGALKGGKVSASCENRNNLTTIKNFQVGHPVNPLDPSKGTYDNLYTGAKVGAGDGTDTSANGNYPGALPLSVESIRIVRNAFGMQLGTNGVDPRGYVITHIACGLDLAETLLTLIKEDMLLVASGSSTALVYRQNPLKKYPPIVPLINPFLNESGVWYPISADEMGECPWISLVKVPNNPGQVPGMPGPGIVMEDGIEWVTWDEQSTLYKEGSKMGPVGSVAIKALVEAGAGISLSWRIKRCEAT
jgi:hypothetical protein